MTNSTTMTFLELQTLAKQCHHKELYSEVAADPVML